jgi:hypothetical protein
MMGYMMLPRDASQEPRRIVKRGYVPKVNKYPGVCECGAHVPAGDGAITRTSGQWIVYCSQHKGNALY